VDATESISLPSANARPPRSSVLMGIAGAGALFAVLFALLLYQALTVHPPQAALLVQADPHWDGAILIVEGDNLARSLNGDLNRGNKYLVTFFLQPGDYKLHVRKGDKEYLVIPVHLESESKNRANIGVDLRIARVTPPHPTTQF
jgi:hypothetical protein